jgi:secondary thiamine-phosphate synthase enzyme
MVYQTEIALREYPRGFHLITRDILEQIGELPKNGVLHIFIKHTSAGLTINENADPTVRQDFESSFNQLVKEDEPYYIHTLEGSDDMPAHIKSTLVGSSISVPITDGRLNLGTWQGIYLCEFRNHGGRRKLVVTIYS